MPSIFSNFEMKTVFNSSTFLESFKAIVFGVFLLYFTIIFIGGNFRINIKLLVVLGVLTLISFFAVFSLNNPTNIMAFIVDSQGVTNSFVEVQVPVSFISKILSIYATLANVVIFYFFIDILPQLIKKDETLLYKFFTQVRLLILVFVLYSIVLEFDLLIDALKKFPNGNLSSLFAQKNSFARIMFFAFLGSFYLVQKKKDLINIILLVSILIYTIILGSLNVLLAVFIFILVYYTFHMFKNRKRYKKIFLLSLLFYSITLIFLVLVLSPISRSIPILSKIHNTISSFIDDPRLIVWESVIYSLGTTRGLVFGYGDKLISTFVYASTSQSYVKYLNVRILHNGLLEVLFTGGIFRFVAYCLLLVSIFDKIQRTKKHDFKMFSFLASVFISFIFFQMFETSVLGTSTSDSFILSILLISLVCSFDKTNEFKSERTLPSKETKKG